MDFRVEKRKVLQHLKLSCESEGENGRNKTRDTVDTTNDTWMRRKNVIGDVMLCKIE